MLLVSSATLAQSARDMSTREDFAVCIFTAAGVVGINSGVGFVLGIAVFLLSRLREWLQEDLHARQ